MVIACTIRVLLAGRDVMHTVFDPPPQNVQNDLNLISAALDAAIPVKANDNLLIATWNIRSFSSLTREWTAGANDSPKRDLRGLRAIIEILSRFDVIAYRKFQLDGLNLIVDSHS